jgi:hypothetical protein
MAQELEKEIPTNDNELKHYYGIHYQPSTQIKERSHQASGCNNVDRRLYYSPQSSQITRTIFHMNELFPFQFFLATFRNIPQTSADTDVTAISVR